MLVGYEVDRSIDEQSEKLGKIFIAVEQLHKYEKKQKLCTVSHSKSTSKE